MRSMQGLSADPSPVFVSGYLYWQVHRLTQHDLRKISNVACVAHACFLCKIFSRGKLSNKVDLTTLTKSTYCLLKEDHVYV
jgi:hypothetical protein